MVSCFQEGFTMSKLFLFLWIPALLFIDPYHFESMWGGQWAINQGVGYVNIEIYSLRQWFHLTLIRCCSRSASDSVLVWTSVRDAWLVTKTIPKKWRLSCFDHTHSYAESSQLPSLTSPRFGWDFCDLILCKSEPFTAPALPGAATLSNKFWSGWHFAASTFHPCAPLEKQKDIPMEFVNRLMLSILLLWLCYCDCSLLGGKWQGLAGEVRLTGVRGKGLAQAPYAMPSSPWWGTPTTHAKAAGVSLASAAMINSCAAA